MAERAPAKPNGSRRATAGDALFTGGGRQSHLEQLRHLSQWSRRVLLVTGPRGAGKSVLYRQFSATLEPRANAARIDAARVKGPREVLHAMVQGFGLAAPADADVDLLNELVAAHAEERDRTERYSVVLVDDAELLEARSVDVLVKLAASVPLRVVLFGEVRLVTAVERAADANAASWHEIRLGALDAEDVREYLVWWFRTHGDGDGLPFSDAQVREIARLSEGLPGRIDQTARVLLAKLRSEGQGLERRRFPVLHQVLLAVLVVVVGLTYLVWPQGRDEVGDGDVDVERVDVPPLETARVPDGPVNAPPVIDSPVEELPVEELPVIDSPVEELPVEELPVEEPPLQTGDQAESAAPPVPVERPRPDRDVPESVAPEVETPVPESRPEDASAPAAPRDAAWILAQPASAHTLQLVSFSTEARAAAYLDRQDQPESFALFRQQRNGQILHVVIYGRFDSRAEAQSAAADLPEAAGRVQPWIRPFGDVQRAVRTALQG